MVKVGVKSRASGGQEINPLDPRFVTMTVTIKIRLATFCERLAPGRATGGFFMSRFVMRDFFGNSANISNDTGTARKRM